MLHWLLDRPETRSVSFSYFRSALPSFIENLRTMQSCATASSVDESTPATEQHKHEAGEVCSIIR